jgi:hypothetical protein
MRLGLHPSGFDPTSRVQRFSVQGFWPPQRAALLYNFGVLDYLTFDIIHQQHI